MNIFFKLLALGGLGGTVVGAVHLSNQSYTNNHAELSPAKKEGTASDVDVKRQPETSLNPKTKTEATKTEATKPVATKTEVTKTEVAKPVVTKAEATKPMATKTEATKTEAAK